MSLIPRCLRSLMLIGLFSAISLLGQTRQPPVAPVIGHRETRYGTTVVDNYFWLRDKSNPEVIKYLEQENAYTEAMTKPLKPFEDALYTEILSHSGLLGGSEVRRQSAHPEDRQQPDPS